MGMGTNAAAKGTAGVAPTINVTPLVDVVLVLLIIFMVVTPLLSKQFWVHLPKKEEADQPPPPQNPEQPLVLTVDRAGIMRVNQTELSGPELKARLPRMLAARSDKTVYFDGADDAPYAAVAKTLDLARTGGAASIAIMTKKASASNP